MKKYLLGTILVLGLLLRLVGIIDKPAGLTPDEASFGYDAYSILKTGKDQWGKTFPFVLESFGDYKSPLYTYLAIPSVAIFGLNVFAVRLPNAILGTLAILVVYLLCKKLFKNEKLALMAGLLLAISPWHIALSRGAFEANLTTLFLPLGILLFYQEKFVLSALVFGLNLFSYHSAKIVTPLIVLFLIIGLRKFNWKFITVFLIFIGLTVYTFFLGAGRRAQDINIFNGSLYEAAEIRIKKINEGANPTLAHIRYNKYTTSISRFSRNYFSYFSPRFLFLKGPGESTYGMVKGIGVLYLVETISLLAFIYSLFKKKDIGYSLILFWILIAPIPVSLTQGVGFAANRVAIMMPAIQIASVLGLFFILNKFTKRQKLLTTLFMLFISLGALNFFGKYKLANKGEIARSMLYGNIEVMETLGKSYPGQNIFVSTQLSEPHIYWAFANKVDPKIYQEESKNWNYKDSKLSFLDQLDGYKLGNITFGRIDWKKNTSFKGIIVGRPDEFPESIRPEKIYYYPDSKEAIYIVSQNMSEYAKVN